MDNVNPLAQYFRAPGVHQAIPTKGQFFKADEIEVAMNGELAILPMTAGDEIVLKNPDALLNGDALERLFKSCVPGIRAPRKISVPDMDVLLLAIKLASFGDSLEIELTCPKCKKEFTTETSIRGILADMKFMKEEDTVIRVDDNMVIYIRPYSFESKTILDLATFEETKLYQHLLDTEMSDDEKSKIFNKSFEKIAELNLDLLADCVVKINIPGQEVTDQTFIRDYIRNCDKNVVNKITTQLKLLSESGIRKTTDVVCPNEECKHEWSPSLVFDPAHFFA